MNNADMPAMPYVIPSGVTIQPYEGLTKLEMMAMHFHAGLLTATSDGSWIGIGLNAAYYAVREADELLDELERTCQKP